MTSASPTTWQRWKRRKSRVFAHPEDVHCVIYNVVTLAAYAAAFWMYLDPERSGVVGPWRTLAFFLGAGFLLGWISGVNVGVNFHNHAHRPIFRSRALNRWFERFWTFSGGWPAFYWYHAHVVVHHSNLMGETDWTLPKRRADGRFENLYKYCLLHWPWRYVPHLVRDFRNRRGGDWVPRKAAKEFGIFLVLWSIPFWIDPLMALGLWVFPQWVGNAVIMASGMYVQHAGCEPKSEDAPFRHSNSFQSRFFNLTMFNIGYHVVHHDNERVHWSALPRFHQRMKARLVAKGVHAVPYGYYRAANILARIPRHARTHAEFMSHQAPGYGSIHGAPPERPASRGEERHDGVELAPRHARVV